MRDIMKGPKRYGPAVGTAVLGAVLFLAAAWGRWGTGQEKPVKPSQDVQKWTVETHDGTNFPLVGRHRTVACAECHIKGVFEGTPTSCEACHWDRRQDDRYRLRLGAQCGDCHTPMSWKSVPPNAWDHETMTGFRREGVHRTLDCAECHGEDFRKVGGDCYSCHADDYRGAKDPDHVAGGFPRECAACHRGQKSWAGAVAGHEAFPLRGRHQTLDCEACHPGGRYQGTPSDCAACHIKDYNATTEPNHKSSGFPTDCVSCHGNGAVSWEGASFNHSQFFALRGTHATLDCNACHAKGYDLPTDCYGCHAADYNATAEPNHKASGFPTTCEACHLPTHTSWAQAVFQHAFPIKSGRHVSFSCTDCHLTSNYREFSCTDCHTHDKATTDSHHHGVSGYVYNSANCYACHPKGIAD
jgi:hypothetical protein